MKRRKNLPKMATVRLTERLRANIRNAAYQSSQTESQFIRKALEQAIKQRSPYSWLVQ